MPRVLACSTNTTCEGSEVAQNSSLEQKVGRDASWLYVEQSLYDLVATCTEEAMAVPEYYSSQRTFPSNFCRQQEAGAFYFFEPTRIEFRGTADGLTYVWESRSYRKSRRQRQYQQQDEKPGPREGPFRLFGWQPRSFSYWTAISFFIGSIFFIVADILSLLPSAHLPDDADMHFLFMTSIPSLAGALMFLLGASFQYLEVVNVERKVDFERAWGMKQDSTEHKKEEELQERAKTTTCFGVCELHRLDFVAAVILWIGAVLFLVNSVLLVIPPVFKSVPRARRYIWSFSTAGTYYTLRL